MAEAVRRGGAWIACHPGCCECCIGPFSISENDSARLRAGLAQASPEVASRIRARAADYVGAITGFDSEGVPEGLDEAACPALDPETGRCDLYTFRPITCRTFGPAVKTLGGSIAACELCFNGASEAEILASAVEISREALELDAPHLTTVAQALLEV
jgi:Fe-S-cluster containining protein